MKKHILLGALALAAILTASAKKAEVDFNNLSKTGSQADIKAAAKHERTLFFKSFGEQKETFLHLCLKNNRELAIITFCLDNESDVAAKTKDGKTTLMYAAEYETDANVVEYILKANALTTAKKKKKILQKDNAGNNAIYYAEKNSSKDILKVFARYVPEALNGEYTASLDGDATEPTSGSSEKLDDIAALEAELAREAAELEAMTYRGPKSADSISAQTEAAEPHKIAAPEPAPAIEAAAPVVAAGTAIVAATISPAAEEKTENTAPVQETKKEEVKEQDVAAVLSIAEPAVETDLKKKEVEAYASAFLYDYAEEVPAESAEEKKITLIENPDLADKNGVTLLMKAAKAGNDWDVRTLLASGADVNLRDKDGWSALMYAARYQNSLSIINMLMEKGAYPRVRNKFNATPLLMAADYSKNPDIISLLLKNRTAGEDEVFRAFIFAITGNTNSNHVRAAKIKIFLDMGIPLNRVWKGQTPLMYAAQYSSSTDVIKQLMDAGANAEIVNEEGKTAFDFAKNNKRLIHDDIYWSLNTAGTSNAK